MSHRFPGEMLEPRCLRAAFLTGATLSISGSQAGESISITLDRLQNLINVVIGGASDGSFDGTVVRKLRIFLGDGDDSMGIRATEGPAVVPPPLTTVYGGRGDDVVIASVTKLRIRAYGEDGHDVFLMQAAKRATLYGGGGRDTLTGGSGPDLISGDMDDDHLTGLGSADRIDGGDGDDQINGDHSIFSEDASGDTLIGGAGSDILAGRRGDDLLDGGPGNDFLAGSFGADTLIGGEGDDWVFGEKGVDALSGGDGIDTFQNQDIRADEVDDFDSASDLVVPD